VQRSARSSNQNWTRHSRMPRREVIEDLQPLDRPTRVDGRVEARIIDFTNADVAEHLNYLFHGTRGYVFMATLDRSEVKPIPRDQAFRWPEDYDKMIAWIAGAIQKPWTEVFICPYPMRQRIIMEGDTKRSGRKAGASSSRWVIHADIDHPLTSRVSDTLRAWGFRTVASGTPGHVQVYARLSRSLTVAEHRGLAEALRAFVNGDDKISDNDYVKLPGSWNHKNHPRVKEEKRNDRKYPVAILHNGRDKVDADWLIDDLKATPMEAETAAEPTPAWQVVPGSWKYKLPPHLQQYMHMTSDEATDRSQVCMAAVLAFAEYGLTRDHVHTALDTFDPGVEKYKTADRWHNEIDRILGKQRGVAVIGADLEDTLWDRRPELAHIRRTAWASLASPLATLGVVLVEAFQAVSPKVYLPVIGGNKEGGGIRSLNYFVLLEGKSSAGKGTATGAARHAMRFGPPSVKVNIGSGEGIAKVFKRRSVKGEQGEFQWKTRAAILDIPEIGTLKSLMARPENTLTAELCKAWGGERLGFQNSDEGKTVPVDENEYRLGLIVGAQPGACGPLLNGATIGLPQRFIWLPTVDEDVPEEPMDMPETMFVDIPKPDVSNGPYVIKLPEIVRKESWALRHKAVTGKLRQDPLDGHAMLVRIKTAVGFALLAGRLDVNEEDWELAGVLMAVSTRTRKSIQAELASMDRKADVRAGERAAQRKIVETAAIERDALSRVEDKIRRMLKRNHDAGRQWVGGVQAKMPRDRTEVPKALARMLRAGVIRRRPMSGGHQYQLKAD
jgi:hypothetical protein